MSEVEGHHFSDRKSEDVDALAVVSVAVGPVRRDEDAFALRESPSTPGVS